MEIASGLRKARANEESGISDWHRCLSRHPARYAVQTPCPSRDFMAAIGPPDSGYPSAGWRGSRCLPPLSARPIAAIRPPDSGYTAAGWPLSRRPIAGVTSATPAIPRPDSRHKTAAPRHFRYPKVPFSLKTGAGGVNMPPLLTVCFTGVESVHFTNTARTNPSHTRPSSLRPFTPLSAGVLNVPMSCCSPTVI